MDELRRRERILQALRNHRVTSLPHVSQFVRDYYEKPAYALTKIGLEQEIRPSELPAAAAERG